MKRRRFARFGAAAALLLLAGCVAPAPPTAPPKPPKAKLVLESSSFAALPGWRDDRISAALPALLKSCARRLAQPGNAKVGPDGLAGTVENWRAPCEAASHVPPGDDAAARAYFERWFRPLLATADGQPEGLFTGYYTPLLDGARHRGGAYTTPLLRRPPDLVMVQLGLFRPEWRGDRIAGKVVSGNLLPYATRAEIERGALDANKLALYWVRDPVDAFFLEVQGSGKIRLRDGSTISLGYDGQNGRPYVSIGKLLIERGELTKDQVSLDSIKNWIRAHPDKGSALLDDNPSYVFFREIKGETPIGAEGAVLTAGRSLAVDRAYLPLGIPVFLDARNGDENLRRLVIAQDTGGAIRGPVRGDLYWGFGAEAGRGAGAMKARGRYFLLLPKTVDIAVPVS
ncbi:MAG TPA: murein transglycosylase A [Stellaceae bacterium]|nr:murein transglycosylase A [Stellaceae bacterium]